MTGIGVQPMWTRTWITSQEKVSGDIVVNPVEGLRKDNHAGPEEYLGRVNSLQPLVDKR